jgi:ferredoxin-NADP reductase
LEKEVKVGDEIAVKPGVTALEYRGQYLPVTDLVFMVYGCGIIPIVDQVKSVLPKSSSTSVKSVSVVWVNDDPTSFDLAFNELEREFYKYSTKLEISCCVEDVSNSETLTDFEDIEHSVPDFLPGTMAVISGSSDFSNLAYDYLLGRNFPDDCICMLPP